MSEESDKPRDAEVGAAGDAAAAAAAVDGELSEAELAELDKPAFTNLLKRSLGEPDDSRSESERNARLLASVQNKLRKRSKGKFYGDGWSTTPSRLNYALIAGVMLVTIIAVYLALGPTAFTLR
ncbi:MAG TPA: hypothetical protein VM580_28305 [Labilithrix sp.]|jgi:hypothetical protein|nr:hypothetical protein [Labilithrix sp.]